MSNPRLSPCVPFPLEDQILRDVIEKAKDWALMHGACMRSKINFNSDVLQFAPFALLPSTFPRKEFEKAINIQPILNELMHKVAHDYEFLYSSLKSTITVDPFTSRLFDLYETVRKEGITQPVSLGLVRSDLMLESTCPPKTCPKLHSQTPTYCCWKQVEINTIASGFGWLGPVSGLIHRFVLEELGKGDLIQNLPENNALQGLCKGMLDAWKIYNNPKAVILFVVEDVSYNICDQRFHEYEIRRQNPAVKVLRRSLTQLGAAQLTDTKALLIDGFEVAVVYFRSGYEPAQYHGDLEWEARLRMERSRAIKCPSIYYHLAGTKKVQQSLAHPKALERFLGSDTHKIEAVRNIFTGLYSLDKGEFGDKAVQMALENPSHFVLKPQREGGGNNKYSDEVREALLAMKDSEERSAWILMDRILPPVQSNYVVRPGDTNNCAPPPSDVVSELGIFGVIIGDADTILSNQQVGHMLRTKLSTVNEGGVAAGLGALDSPYLVDLDNCCD
ncbi:hypothetical protein B566_EDAN015897 [Ephemera danica]|nr:hypothetical protein B566_EDAN015897 [Ephemera danica]